MHVIMWCVSPAVVYRLYSCRLWFMITVICCCLRAFKLCLNLLFCACPTVNASCIHILLFCVLEFPNSNGVPPLTPGTNQKVSQALMATFKSFEEEQMMHRIPKGSFTLPPQFQFLHPQLLSPFPKFMLPQICFPFPLFPLSIVQLPFLRKRRSDFPWLWVKYRRTPAAHV